MDRGEFQIEICAGGVESCQAALQGGADRVELCAALPEGGITPSYGEIKVAREVLDDKAAMHVMIRPRGGDFVYSRLELDRMAVDIDVCRLPGADGVVFGCLLPDGSIDEQACTRLMRHARGMNVTFHRAFDLCRDPLDSLTTIAQLGFNRILTSGQQPRAEQGASLLRQLHEQAQGRIHIMAGCGIDESNIARLCQDTGLREFHFSARVPRPSRMQQASTGIYMGTPCLGGDEGSIEVTSAARVEAAIGQLLQLPEPHSATRKFN